MNRFSFHPLVLSLLSSALTGSSAQPTIVTNADWQILSIKKIWDTGRHNAFTDLIRFKDRWFCTFREGDEHVGGDGTARVLTSQDGTIWVSCATISEKKVDLRDPKLSITPENRLMMVLGGSIYDGKTYKGRQPRVCFSEDGQTWTTPRRIMSEGDWLWRVAWSDGAAYGISYATAQPRTPENEWQAVFVQSNDGADFGKPVNLNVAGRPSEGTVRFPSQGRAIALLRREKGGGEAWIGTSAAPFQNWQWKPAGLHIGGPNFIVMPDGSMVAGGRLHQATGPKTFIGSMTLDRVTPHLLLPSGGDTSYPGMVWHNEILWVSYYSSHEGKTFIYLAQVKLPRK